MPIHTAGVKGVVLSDHLNNVDWVARSTNMTGELVPHSMRERVLRLVERVVDVG